jgi:hypothetical protein
MSNRENNTLVVSFLSLAIAGAMAFSLGAAFVHGLGKQAGIYAAERESMVAARPCSQAPRPVIDQYRLWSWWDGAPLP